MTTNSNEPSLSTPQPETNPAAQTAASLLERQRAAVAAHQSTFSKIDTGQMVTSRYRGAQRGIMLALDDPRAWASSRFFPGASENNLPAQEEVTAHVVKCLVRGEMRKEMPVAWFFGMVLWDSVANLDVAVEPTPNTEIFADRPHILRQLDGFAESDMRRARGARDNEILIAQTRRGLVGLAYDPATRIYTLTTQDGGSFQTSGTKAKIKAEIINLYDCQEMETQEEGRKAA